MADHKKRNGILILLGTGLAALGLYKLKSLSDTANDIQLKILSFKITGITKLYLTIQIFNPTRNTITIDSIVGEILFNDTSIGNLQYINKAPIQPQSYTNFPDVLVDLSPSGSVTMATQIVTQSVDSGTFKVNGKIYIKGVGIPFSQSVKVF